MSGDGDYGDDLKQTLMRVVAYSDLRNQEVQGVSFIKKAEPVEDPPAAEKSVIQTGVKRKHTEDVSPAKKVVLAGPSGDGYAGVVASHYNTLEEKALDQRCESRIFYMKNFHN